MVFSLYLSPLYLEVQWVGYELFFDYLSYALWVLRVWLIVLMLIARWRVRAENSSFRYFRFLLNLILVTLMLTFRVRNFLGLYIFFEASLIPTLLVIVGWGYQTERLQAGVYFLFYTITSSLPLLAVFLLNYRWYGSLELTFQVLVFLEDGGAGLFELIKLMALTRAFLVKMPLFFVHLWLPKAHVEAPVAGSIILAGVLLKLGGYGLCRVLNLYTCMLGRMRNLMTRLGLVSIIVVGLICCRLNDMRALVAYSSVAHIGLVVCGLFIGGILGLEGSLIMIIGHGVASSGLFSILNMYYERTGRRRFYTNRGIMLVLPVLVFYIFMLSASNMGAPPSINLLSELYLLGGLIGWDWAVIYGFPLGSFMGVVFTIFLFSYSQHGRLGISSSRS